MADHLWVIDGNYRVVTLFFVVMAIYRYVERIGEFLLPPIFLYNKYDHEKCYPGELVHIHIQPLINIIQEKIG